MLAFQSADLDVWVIDKKAVILLYLHALILLVNWISVTTMNSRLINVYRTNHIDDILELHADGFASKQLNSLLF